MIKLRAHGLQGLDRPGRRRGLDALNQLEKIRVLLIKLDDMSNEAVELCVGIAEAMDGFARLFVETLEAVDGEAEIELFLVVKVAIEGSLGDAGLVGDVVHADFVIAMLGEKLGSGF